MKPRHGDDRIGRLTEREREALKLIAEGRSNRSIAERPGITTKTLEGMSGTIISKLGLEDDPDVNRRVLAVLLYLDGRADDRRPSRASPSRASPSMSSRSMAGLAMAGLDNSLRISARDR